MARFINLSVAGFTAIAVAAGSTGVQAAPFPAASKAQVGGPSATVDQVGWRRGYRGGYRRNAAGALFAGAALGLIGTAIAASARPRYYGYGYGYPAYGYAPAYYGGYPAYGYGGYGYGGYPYYGY